MKWIDATQLETWGRSTFSETELPALVADLICATTSGISSIRFPSRGKGRVRGFDGVLECDEASLFVPMGKSVWELKSSATYKLKAVSDFEKRTADTDPEEQKQLTLILVTPFTWDSSNKKNTIEACEADWKKISSWQDIRIIDGTKLEHWLDFAPAVAARWSRGSIRSAPAAGVQSIEEYWQVFSARFDPRIIEELLTTEREANVEELLRVLAGPAQLISMIGDAPEFVVAFAVAAIRSAKDELREFLAARTLVVDTPEAGRELAVHKNLVFLLRREAAKSPRQFADVGPTLVPLARWHRSSAGSPLPRQTSYATKQVLLKMEMSEGRAETLSRGCGGSLSALERMMPGGAYDAPEWKDDLALLLPAFLAGAWDSANAKDHEVIAALAGTVSYTAYETQIRRFLDMEDAPIIREENVYKVTAPIDAFVRSGRLIGEDHLETLRPQLVKVFGQLDPKPDPNEPFYNRGSPDRHSDWLRDGLATTILLVAAWQKQAGLTLSTGRGQAFANEVVEVLPGLGSDYRVMTSLKDELPLLAEAAPFPFLQALERMLEGSGEVILPIFDQVEGFAFPVSVHTGVLWALETLAWDPNLFRRACLILSGLAAIDPGGRITNRPAASLTNILLPWLPCTHADLHQRLAVLDEIILFYPAIGWELLLKLLPGQTTHSSGTSQPRLRGADLAPQSKLSNGDVWTAQKHASSRAVMLATHDAARMQKLLAPMLQFDEPERIAGQQALDETLTSAELAERDVLWQALHEQIIRHRRFSSASWSLDADAVSKLEAIADRHRPTDPVLIASELFSYRLGQDDPKRITAERVAAVRGLAETYGSTAVRALMRRSRQSHLVLEAICSADFDEMFLKTLLREEFEAAPNEWRAGSYFSLLRSKSGRGGAVDVAHELFRSSDAGAIAKLFRAWPAEPETWEAIAGMGDDVVARYWEDFEAHNIQGVRRILLSVVVQLIRRKRSLVALETSLNRLNEVPTCLVLRMLDSIVGELNAGQKPRIGVLLDYELEETFKSLDQRDLPDMEIGRREYALLPLLELERRPLKLHNLMAGNPEMFHQLLRDVYRAENTEGGEVEPSEEGRARWRQAYKLLSEFSTVPGYTGDSPDEKAFDAWVAAVRALGVQHDRKDVTDIVIGNVLAHAPVDDVDQVWPHRFVRNLLETDEGTLSRGTTTERFNMRGVTVRGPLDGGNQERELAARYRKDAKRVQRWPKTSAMLTEMAERWDTYADHEDIDARQRKLRN